MFCNFFIAALSLALIINNINVYAGQVRDNCLAKWTLVYHHDNNGRSLSGNKHSLMGAVLSGARIRVSLGPNYYTEAQGVYVKGGEVQAELLNHVSKASWNRMQSNAYWWWVMVSTRGTYYMTRYYVGGGYVSSTNSKTSAKWFAKPACFKPPIYSLNKMGKAQNGALTALKSAVRKGHDLRCVTGKRHAFGLNNVAIGKGFVAGQNVEHVSKRSSGNRIVFQNNAYWYFTILSTKGTRDASRWSIGSHTNRGHTNDRTDQQWFNDACWTRVYAHKSNGGAISGTLSALVSAIQSGKRIRFQFPTQSFYTAEADNLSIRNGHVTAQALKHVSKNGYEKFQDNAYWYWLMVSTTGTVRETRYDVGAHVSRGNTESKREVHWFVDTRPWTLALDASANGDVTSGSKSALAQAVRDGASVRIVQKDGLYAFPADNLAINKNEVAAQTLYSITHQPLNQYEIRIKKNPYWWYIIVDTTGRREMSRWSVGQHTSRGHSNDRLALKWFVNK